MSVVSVCMGNAQWVTSMLCYVDYSFYDLMAYCTSADVDAIADEERERESMSERWRLQQVGFHFDAGQVWVTI